MKSKERIGIMYLCIHKRLQEESTLKIICRKKALHILGVLYHVPKRLKKVILKEMELFNLLERHNRDKLEILDTKLSLDNTSKIYRQVRLY